MADIYDFIPKPGVARFFQQQRERDVRYLIAHYGVTEEKADQAFCEGCHALLENIHNRKLTAENFSGSLEGYLMSCCRNQLMKLFEKEKKDIIANCKTTDDDRWTDDNIDDSWINDKGNWVDIATDQHESDLRLMEKIVADLPSPCEDLIYGKYFNHFSPYEMAMRLGYGGARVAITTLSRCMKKLKDRFYKERRLLDE